MKKVLVVNNPNAGRKKALRYKKSVIKFLFRNNICFKSINIGELTDTDITKFDTVIAIGGDGTVNKIIPLIINTDIKLGIIPCGTANLLSAKLGISADVDKALNIIKNGEISLIDALKIAYFLAGVLFALRLKQKHYTIFFEDKKLSIVTTCIIIANAGNMFRNLFSISQDCKLDDGLADVFILKVKNPIMFFIEFLQIIFNKKSSGSKAMYFQTSNFKIKNDFTTGHIDGEKTKFKDDIEISIIPKSVKIFSNTYVC